MPIESLAQEPSQSLPPSEVVLAKLSPPAYPAIARAARVSGLVEVALRIRQDGIVDSADVVGGHPLLKQAALDSARKSQFECRSCNEPLTSYALIYSFEFTSDAECCQVGNAHPEPRVLEQRPGVTQSGNRISVLTDLFCTCDPGPAISRRDRSMKCFFLWRCGKRRMEATL